jgi:hypothetical protein
VDTRRTPSSPHNFTKGCGPGEEHLDDHGDSSRTTQVVVSRDLAAAACGKLTAPPAQGWREPRKQPWLVRLGRLARLGRSPLVLSWKAASLTSGEHALAVRVPTSLTVALGCDEHVRAHCV